MSVKHQIVVSYAGQIIIQSKHHLHSYNVIIIHYIETLVVCPCSQYKMVIV